MVDSPFGASDIRGAADTAESTAARAGWLPPPPGASWLGDSEPLPKLRLHHLFALTAAVAVILGINGPQRLSAAEGFPFGRWVQIVIVSWGIFYTILTAIAVTFVAYGIAWRRRGTRFFHEPGHWLLVDISIGAVLMAIMHLVNRAVVSQIENENGAPSMSILWLMPLVLYGGGFGRIVFDIWIGVKKCYVPRWKWIFFTKAIAMFAQVLGNSVMIVQVLGDLVVLLLLVRAGRVDRRSHIERDIGHYCGVWLQMALCATWALFVVLILGGLFTL